MRSKHRTRIVAGVATLFAAVGVAGAVAATGVLSPKEESQAIVDDVAAQLDVESSELTAAVKSALKARVDAAVEAGRLTEAQATELKARIDSDDYPLFGVGRGGPGHGHFHHFGGPDAAASYLGVAEEALRTELSEGQTLAEVAEANGKTVDGLVAAMVAAARADLQEAVTDGRLTDAQRDEIVATLEERITAKVNGELGPGPGRGGPGFGPPPSGSDSDSGSSSSSVTPASVA
jgi:hypothetical protein